MLMLAIILGFFPLDALAYLDPASGSALAYVVISVVSASFYSLKNFSIKTFNWAFRKKNKNAPQDCFLLRR
jgi:uncharacterized membrane protein